MTMKFWLWPSRFICKIRKIIFIRKFAEFGDKSGFGRTGYGDSCYFEGAENIFIGNNSWVGISSELLAYSSSAWKTKLIIGDFVHVQARCRITCARQVKVGNYVLIGPEVFITDHNHGMNPEMGGYNGQPLVIKDVTIEDGVWLGQRVCVMPGVTIGAHSIVGANSTVTHDIPPYCVAVGSPAKVIKQWDFYEKKWIEVNRTTL